MRIALLGRTQTLLETGKLLKNQGHEIVLVATGRPSPEDTVAVEDFCAAASEWGSDFLDRVNLNELTRLLMKLEPDIGVSVNYPTILPTDLVEAPRLGILNAHGGDLPRFRGNACQAWAIIVGEKRIGLCIHRMVGGAVDAGDIIAREYLPIDDATQIGEVLRWIDTRAPELFLESLRALSSNPHFVLERQSADPRVSLRCFPRRPEDGRIDWRADALSIVRLINASGSPYPGAFCTLEDKHVIIELAEVAQEIPPYLAVPGQVLEVSSQFVTVACGEGAIRITKSLVQPNAIPLTEIVRSIRARLT